MGKSGAALRAAKMQSTKYVFTREQLLVHDHKIREEFAARYREEVGRYINAEWDRRREEFATGDSEEDFNRLLSYLLSISAMVLVRDFKWAPVPDWKAPGNNRLARFAAAAVEEINGICQDEEADIRTYCEKAYAETGLKFILKEENDK